jgi:hypothetical protein
VKNYSDSKAGKMGEFHHTLGACVVDIVGKKFFMYQVNAEKDGSFIHLDRRYTPTHSEKAPPADGIAFGDTHRAFIDRKVETTTFGEGGIVDTLDPKYMVFHDLHDGYAENPHHRKDPFVKQAKHISRKGNVQAEVMEDIRWLDKVIGNRIGVLVPSNHDNFLRRWITDTDWRYDPGNALFYMKTAIAMLESTTMGAGGSETVDPFLYWVAEKIQKRTKIKLLKRDDSFVLSGVEMALHGDMGPNGSRGSRMALRRIGVKSVIGHSHSPGIEEGCYQTGTSTSLRLEYNKGPGSWLNTHCVVYANGKRSLINIIDGEWRFK